MQEIVYESIAGLITVASIASLFLPRQRRESSPGSLEEGEQVASETGLGRSISNSSCA